MQIEVVRDTNKRYCSVCKHRIKKKDIIVKYKEIIDTWKNTRMWFAHVKCLVNKLESLKVDIEKKLNKVPEIRHTIERYERG